MIATRPVASSVINRTISSGQRPSEYNPFTLNADQTRGGYSRLAALIAARRDARQALGPVLVLDGGDYSMGTAFGAATRETGGELRLLAHMGYDATTFGNHDFDLGVEGLARSIAAAAAAGPLPAIVASNTSFGAQDPTMAGVQRLVQERLIRSYTVIERGGIRFGIFGVIGKEAIFYTTGAGAVSFSPFLDVAQETVTILRHREKVDVVIALSHGGVEKGPDGQYADGDDVRLGRVPGIDVVVGGHSHTELPKPIIANGRTPVVQTGVSGRNLGELVIKIDGGTLTVDSYQLHPIDNSVAGDLAIQHEIADLKKTVTDSVFASRGYSVDQPLAVVPVDLPNTFTDIAAGTILANLVTDAFREATKAEIGFTANGMMRSALTRGKSGVQTVYDVFAMAPLGAGVVDDTAGSALVTAYFSGQELKHVLEFFLIENPAHPGEYFPRVSGMRFRYGPSRPKFERVIAIELGDLDHGYADIDITGKVQRLYSVTCSLYLGIILAGIPKFTKGALPLVPKNKDGKPLASRVEALDYPRTGTGYLLPPPGAMDKSSVATGAGNGAIQEIKEWQAIMDHLRNLPVKTKGDLPSIPVDAPAAEVRAIKVS